MSDLPTRDAFIAALCLHVLSQTMLVDSECDICSCRFGEPHTDSAAVRLHDGHIYCKTCAVTWLSEANTCPACRRTLFVVEEDGENSDDVALPPSDAWMMINLRQYDEHFRGIHGEAWWTSYDPGIFLEAILDRGADSSDGWLEGSGVEYPAAYRSGITAPERHAEEMVRVNQTTIMSAARHFFLAAFCAANQEPASRNAACHPLAATLYETVAIDMEELDGRSMTVGDLVFLIREDVEKAFWRDAHEVVPQDMNTFMSDLIKVVIGVC